jgi:sialate O-acetylesterase
MNTKKNLIFTLFVMIASISYAGTKKYLEMPALFCDNMVLQQRSNVPFWGKAMPGTQISIKASWGTKATVKVSSDSTWLVKIKTPKAGGPFTVDLAVGDTTINYKNVLIGEVWLCSGQSNMEMPLVGWPPKDTIAFSAREIKNADNPNIRLFTVARAYSNKPLFNVVGTWSECNPQTASSFSATAFFFGKKLAQDLKIPIGLINSCWGGTAIEPWISKKDLAQYEKFTETLKKIDECQPMMDKFNEWLVNHPIIDVSKKDPLTKWKDLDFQDADCAKPEFNDSKWRTMKLPDLWEMTEVGNYDGIVWFRKQIKIPKEWLNKDLVVELGPIDDMDVSYINGKRVGGYEENGFYQVDRIYPIPAEIVKDSVLTIAVRVIDNQGGGGIGSFKTKMNVQLKGSGEQIEISGAWKYLPVAQYVSDKFYVFGIKDDEYFNRPKLPIEISSATPTALYNGMIAPLVPYAIKGAIWYQGESNVGNAEMYKSFLPTMIKDWRNNFQNDLSFYYAQIAPWSYNPGSGSQKIREAQMVSLSTPKTGMAVLMDLGSPNTIHPPYKKEVGERLAFWALAKDYGKKIVYSGPIYKSMKVQKDKIVLNFDYSDGGLVLKSKDGENNFMIAGEDKVFKKADVKIDGKKLVVSSPEVTNPVAVRYGWAEYVDGSLFNKAGLPASSFRTDDWKE